MKIISILNIILALILSFSSTAQAVEKGDSLVGQNPCKFKAKDIVLPGALFAIGASSLFFSPMEDLDHSLQKDMLDLRGNHHRIKLDEYLRYVPTVINVSLNMAGIDSKYTLSERLLIKLTSVASMYVLTQGLKHTIDRTRPDGSDNHSFPSGHVATVFLGAESLRISHGNWWGLAGYSAATATAFLRMYNNRHWFSDVVSAAGIGILSARIGYWLLPLEKHILGMDDNRNTGNTTFVAMPSIDVHNRSYGLSLALQF